MGGGPSSRLASANPWWIASAIFLGALALRLAYLLQLRNSPFADFIMGDGKGYLEWAQSLAAGNWVGDRVFYQAPLYPYLLGLLRALFGESLWLIRALQTVLGSLSCVCLYQAGQRLLSRPIGVIAGVLGSVYAPAIFFDGLIQKTSLAFFLMSLTLWIVGVAHDTPRKGIWFGAGMALGGLVLVQENAFLLVGLLCSWPWLSRAWPLRLRLTCSGGCLLGVLLLVGPVGLRNWVVGDTLTLTTSQLGPNLYLGNNPKADGLYRPLVPGHGSYVDERQDATELAERAVGRSLSPGEVSDYWLQQVEAFVVNDPAAWLALTWKKWLLLWSRHEIPDTDDPYIYQQWSWLLRVLGSVFHFGTLAPLAGIGLVLGWRKYRPHLCLLTTIALVLLLSLLPFVIYGRYRFLLVPELLLLSGCALAEGYRHFEERSLRRLRPALLVGVGVAGVAYWPSFSRSSSLALGHHNLGSAYQASGQLQPALGALDEALRLDPQRYTSWNNRGIVHAKLGQYEEAMRDYDRALQLHPDYASAYYNRGLTRVAQKQWGQALADYSRALSLDPNNAAIYVNRGAVYSAQGRFDQALEDFGHALQLAPGDVDGYLNRGATWLELRQGQRALADVNEALRLAPGNAEAWNRRGAVYFQTQQYTQAIEDFTRAIALNPGRGDLYRNRGWAHALGTHRVDAACQDWNQGCRLGACPPWDRVPAGFDCLVGVRSPSAGAGGAALGSQLR